MQTKKQKKDEQKSNKNNLKHAHVPLVYGMGIKGWGKESQDRTRLCLGSLTGVMKTDSSLESCAGFRWRRAGGN